MRIYLLMIYGYPVTFYTDKTKAIDAGHAIGEGEPMMSDEDGEYYEFGLLTMEEGQDIQDATYRTFSGKCKY